MKIYVEDNLKYGVGYQLRMVDDAEEQVIDFRPYNAVSAGRMARKMLEIYNRKNGTNLAVEDVLTAEKTGKRVTPKKGFGRKKRGAISRLLPWRSRVV